MPEPNRTEAGHRVYDSEQERRLRFILRGRKLGFSINELKSLLRLIDGRTLTCGEVYELTSAHTDDIRRKIVDLRRLETALVRVSAQCRRSAAPECPIVDALFDEPR